jgi:DtxR family Mn-dependent transcriptional regulator
MVLDVTPGTATTMVKRIGSDGLLDYEPRKGCRLTRRGLVYATKILRKHRIIETFLVEVLQMDWADVHDEAERLEHAVSDALLDLLEKRLDGPKVDPHGDLIPSADGTDAPPADIEVVALGECASGTRVRMNSVDDRDSALLKKLGRHGIYPGAMLDVVDSSGATGTVTVKADGHQALTFSRGVADTVKVVPSSIDA